MNSPNIPVKRISWEEMQRRRAQGLCFNCNERFNLGHQCQKPQLLLLEGDNMEPEVEIMEDVFLIKERNPELDLEGKVSLQGEENDEHVPHRSLK